MGHFIKIHEYTGKKSVICNEQVFLSTRALLVMVQLSFYSLSVLWHCYGHDFPRNIWGFHSKAFPNVTDECQS